LTTIQPHGQSGGHSGVACKKTEREREKLCELTIESECGRRVGGRRAAKAPELTRSRFALLADESSKPVLSIVRSEPALEAEHKQTITITQRYAVQVLEPQLLQI